MAGEPELDMEECCLEPMTPTEVSVDPGFASSSLFMRESTWDTVYQHPAPAKRGNGPEDPGNDSDWELLTDPGSSISRCGSPASHIPFALADVPPRAMSPLSPTAAADANVEHNDDLPESYNAQLNSPRFGAAAPFPAQGEVAASPVHVSRCCSVMEEEGLAVPRDLAIVTHPNSRVVSMDSAAGSPRLYSPASVDMVMARAEMQRLRNSVSSWMRHQQEEEEKLQGDSTGPAEHSPEIQAAPGWFVGEVHPLESQELPEGVVAEIQAVQRQLTFSAHDYILGPVGVTAHRLWDWATGKLAALQGAAQELAAMGAARRGLPAAKPRAIGPPQTAEGALKPQPRLVRLLMLLGASNVVMAAALFAAFVNNRRLNAKIKQKDNELSTLLMRIFSLKETLQGGAGGSRPAHPAICNSMSPARHQAYL